MPRRRRKKLVCGCKATLRWDPERALRVGVAEYIMPHRDCGGGIRVKRSTRNTIEFAGHVEDLDAADAEAQQFRVALVKAKAPPATIDELAERLETREQHHRLLKLDEQLVEAMAEGKRSFVRIGEVLRRGKELLPHGQFWTWVRLRGLDPQHACKFIDLANFFDSGQINKRLVFSQEKAHLLYRLSKCAPASLQEWLAEGVPVNGGRQPVERTTYRELAAAARPHFDATRQGKPRGRKPRPAPDPRPMILKIPGHFVEWQEIQALEPDESWGVRAELEEPANAAWSGLRALCDWRPDVREYRGARALYYELAALWEGIQMWLGQVEAAIDQAEDVEWAAVEAEYRARGQTRRDYDLAKDVRRAEARADWMVRHPGQESRGDAPPR